MPDQPAFWGWIADDEIVAVAETYVRHHTIASIQQVYTKETSRRKGISEQLIHGIMAAEKDIDTFTYLVAEENFPSVKLAKKLGFKLHSQFAYIESSLK